MENEQKREILQNLEIDLNFDSKLLGIVDNILQRLKNPTELELRRAMDDELIYIEDEWTILQHYITPKEIGTTYYGDIEEIFFEDIFRYIQKNKEEWGDE